MTSPSNKHKGPVSMKMIAEQIGVTKATVSLALRGHSNVSEKTRQRIVDLANELGYRPDPAIAAIASHRWSRPSSEAHRTLAYICHRKNGQWPQLQGDYFSAAAERAKELGFKLEQFSICDYPNASSASRVLYNRGIRGLIIPPIPNPNSERVANLEWDKFTAVCCAIGRYHPPLHTATYDVFVDTRLAWEKVIERGFTRIGAALNCHRPVAEDDFYRIGASYAARELLQENQEPKIPFLLSEVDDDESLYKWYLKHRPEVIIGFNFATGEKLIQRGIRIPEDVRFVSLITKPHSPFSGVLRQTEQTARTAVDLLASELRDNQWGLPKLPRSIMLKPTWNEGETLGYANSEASKTQWSNNETNFVEPPTLG